MTFSYVQTLCLVGNFTPQISHPIIIAYRTEFDIHNAQGEISILPVRGVLEAVPGEVDIFLMLGILQHISVLFLGEGRDGHNIRR